MALRLGLIGHGIQNSLSPKLQQAFGRWSQIPLSYELIDVDVLELDRAVRDLRREGFDGFNVTAPFKTQFFGLADVLTSEAKCVGAVNTIIRQENGLWLGHNTDIEGLLYALPDHCCGRALVIGAGGVAGTAAWVLKSKADLDVTVINRSTENAEHLVSHLLRGQAQVRPWAELGQSVLETDLVINTVPPYAILAAQIDLKPNQIRPTWLELSYGRAVDPLRLRLENLGWDYIDGRVVLAHQGRGSFRAWTGKDIPPSVAENALNLS